MDHVCDFTSKMIQEIDDVVADPSELECDEYWGDAMPCHVEMLLSLHRDAGGLLPDTAKAKTWRDTYLNVWDGYIDQLEPGADYKTNRRSVLTDLFDRLIDTTSDSKDGG